jgi:CBS-domain-containing membrane protein
MSEFQLTACDIMTQSVLTVSPEASVEAAIRILLESDVTGLPVVDESGRLCGIFTETDRLNMLLTDDARRQNRRRREPTRPRHGSPRRHGAAVDRGIGVQPVTRASRQRF